VSVQTDRFYERRGLLPDPRDGVGGYRDYGDAHLDRLRFVKEAQTLGFTLKEVSELIALRGGDTAREVRARARQKLEVIREKLSRRLVDPQA
jgi:MerR family transcriptional regulator, mercuric resistance operon regulatory protein